jgi:DNA polymerase-3 subunit beta
MKITIDKQQLLTPLAQLSKVAKSKTVEVLNGILFEVSQGQIFLTAGNGTMYVKTTISDGVTTFDVDAVVIPAKQLFEIVRKVGDTLEISAKGTQVTIKSGKSKFELSGLDDEMYPKQQEPSGNSISMEGSDLKRLIKNTTFACATTENMPVLTGVLFQAFKNEITATGCDRHRLSSLKVGVKGMTEPFQATIPASSLEAVSDIVDDDEEVNIIFANNQAVFITDRATLATSLLEGSYPDTSKLIPTDYKSVVTVALRGLHDALERVGIVAKDNKAKIVKISASGKEAEISSANEGSKASEALEVSVDTGEVTASFNVEYALEALKAVDGDKVRICYNGSMNPIILKGDDENAVQLILPYRTTS